MSCSTVCELFSNTSINDEYFVLQFVWEFKPPKAGQFFMLKPLRSSVFLPRPISIFEYNPEQKTVKFLISRRGKGTQELSQIYTGEKVQLAGPFGNCWSDFLEDNQNIALVGGSAGVAPLAALVAEKPDYQFHFYAGFKQGFREKEEEDTILGCGTRARKIIVTSEDGRNALIGKIVDFILEPESYDAVFGCGPMPMMNALKKKCEAYSIPCFLSMESRFACGIGACLGCSISALNGRRRCCKDGPIFPAGEIIFDV